MSLPLLLSETTKWYEGNTSKFETEFLNANDFDLAIRDSFFISNNSSYDEKYTDNFKNLRWFQLDKPNIYMKELSNFLNYLTYYLIIKILNEDEYTVYDLEKLFTEQVLAYLTRRESNSVKIKKIYDYWSNTLKVIEFISNITRNNKNTISNTNVYFTASNNHYKLDIPLVCLQKNNQMHCYLFVTYSNKKPNWFTIPALYKIYAYYADQNISITNMNLIWFDLNSETVKPKIETIPLTPNVAEMVRRYRNVSPYPYENLFRESNPKYYKTTPLKNIL